MNHSACGNERKSKIWPWSLPTRLVDIDANSPRVVNSSDLEPSTAYLTLSHCWGDANFLKLTSNNISELMSGLPSQELSQTHRDSLSVTRRLGYRFIWIDSLCIIQDSVEDWRAESKRMASIYGNSTCNIAAKGATSHAGCFVRRNPLILRPCQLNHPTDPARGIYAHPYVTAGYHSFNSYNYSTNAPLLDRAWVQQERLLAPRLLYFGGQEIHWECCTLQASETWPFGPPSTEHGFDQVFPLKAAFESELRPFVEWSNDDLYAFIYELWRNGIVKEYTAAKLTFEKDRLAAFAGIVSVIQARTGLSYVAGLWKELLPLELLWYRIDPLKPAQNYRVDSEAWKPPTWSWTSVLGGKRYSVAALAHPNSREETYSCQVVECTAQPLDADTPILEQLSRASLTLKGYLVPKMKSFHNSSPGQSDTQRVAGSSDGSDIYFDINVAQSMELFYFLVIRYVNERGHYTDHGLVLALDDPHTANFYVRVGYFARGCDDLSGSLFADHDECTISIA